MFTGIIEELGEVKNILQKGNYLSIEIKSYIASQDITIGGSISVNGACLTLVENKSDTLKLDIIGETKKVTNLGLLKIGEKVNLERALKIGDRLSGHFVTGHIDCIGIIRKRNYITDNLSFEITVPQEFSGYIIPKGSIAIDGISLTIADKKQNSFLVHIIPHTLQKTTLKFKNPSDKVNVEFDILAKKPC